MMLVKISLTSITFYLFFRIFLSRTPDNSTIFRTKLDQVELFDQIILTMKAGFGFDTTLRVVCSEILEWNFLQNLARNETFENSNHNLSPEQVEVIKILSFCLKRPSQAYKLLDFYRSHLKVRGQLAQKQNSISLQAKVQAMMGGCIFLLIFVFQWLSSPDFKAFLCNSDGRCTLLLALSLLSLGIWLVFKIARKQTWSI